jgi:hypothetical protein
MKAEMSEDKTAVVVIGSNRGRLLAYAVGATALGIVAGFFLEGWGFLSTSPLGELAAATGLPVVAIAVAGSAAVVAVVMLKDDWNRTIVIEATAMRVRDNLGQYTLPYSNIHSVTAGPAGGVVLSLRDPELWLASTSGSRGVRERTAALISRQYGGHVWFSARHLSIGVPRFIGLVQEKIADHVAV